MSQQDLKGGGTVHGLGQRAAGRNEGCCEGGVKSWREREERFGWGLHRDEGLHHCVANGVLQAEKRAVDVFASLWCVPAGRCYTLREDVSPLGKACVCQCVSYLHDRSWMGFSCRY